MGKFEKTNLPGSWVISIMLFFIVILVVFFFGTMAYLRYLKARMGPLSMHQHAEVNSMELPGQRMNSKGRGRLAFVESYGLSAIRK